MKTYKIEIIQNFKGCYAGDLYIEAKSKKKARKIINSLTQDEIEIQTKWDEDKFAQTEEDYEFNSGLVKIK